MSKADEILEALAGAEAHPAETLREATKRKKELVPVFLAEIERWLEGKEDEESRPVPLFYIFHLLGSWRATAAYESLCRVLRTDPARLEEDLSDALTETAPRVMANLFEGDYVPLAAVVEDDAANEFARGAALETLGALLHQGRVARADVVEYLRGLAGRLDAPRDHNLWVAWTGLVADFRLDELREEAERVFARRLLSSDLMSATDLRLALAGKSATPDAAHWEPFGDAAEELADWEVFTVDEEETAAGEDEEEVYEPGEPAHNPYRDIGRNDPCPCGSGKKFKKCCGR